MPPPLAIVPTPPGVLDPGDPFEFDPWIPPEIQERTIAWARAERPVTPAEARPFIETNQFGPWGVRPEISACTANGGTWSPDASYERLRGLGGRCDLADGTECGALDFMRGACPGPPVGPDLPPVEPDPIDPFPVDPIPPTTPANGQPDTWLLLVAAIALLG